MIVENWLTGIGERLRTAREQAGQSLDDIAVATRINRKYLEEIERGIPPKLPDAYVSAFIKSYAEVLGITMHDVPPPSKSLPPEKSPARDPQSPVPSTTSVPHADRKGSVLPATSERRKQRGVLIVLFLLLLAGFAASLFWLKEEHRSSSVQEINFNDVVKEQDSLSDTTAKGRDSLPAVVPPPAASYSSDSLTLMGVTTDSVWMRIAIDGKPPREYTLPSITNMEWKAKTSFLIDVGRGNGVNFSLNGRSIGFPGASERPVKNISYTRETLKSIGKETIGQQQNR